MTTESASAELIGAQSKGELLFQTYTNGVGHRALTGPQISTGVGAIDAQVRTGVRPTAAEFPAALGFVPGFEPPPMLQP